MTETANREEIADHVEAAFDHPPASRTQILETARRSGARSEVLSILERLPADQTYRHLRDLWPHLPHIPVTA